ncbi:MAG TPA: hypothetical protein PLO23_05135 [Alphaproteobacteria bacterium]|nr:hypothetical protein [Alphaproteobacteria bacterium]
MDFNQSTELPRFMYKPHETQAHSWVIFEYKNYKGPKGGYDAIGSYEVTDRTENPELSEKKLNNIIILMNGKKNPETLQNLTYERVLYNIVPKDKETDPTKVVLRVYNGQGVSKENAVLTLERGLFDE